MTPLRTLRRLRTASPAFTAAALVALAAISSFAAGPAQADAPTAAQPGHGAKKAPQRPSDKDPVALGRYLVQTTGCNDCHTAGYAMSAGNTPEAQWLTGDSLGWRGPWGTSYPSNLRLSLARFNEGQWLHYARNLQARPPMPWFGLREMSDTDLLAIYRYVRAAGPAGEPAPAALPPGQMPVGPAIQFPGPPQ
jgi:mono/diheme cytochrome c family protein